VPELPSELVSNVLRVQKVIIWLVLAREREPSPSLKIANLVPLALRVIILVCLVMGTRPLIPMDVASARQFYTVSHL